MIIIETKVVKKVRQVKEREKDSEAHACRKVWNSSEGKK